jgi:hypothetical protein
MSLQKDIKISILEIECEGVKWTELAQDSVKWQEFVSGFLKRRELTS